MAAAISMANITKRKPKNWKGKGWGEAQSRPAGGPEQASGGGKGCLEGAGRGPQNCQRSAKASRGKPQEERVAQTPELIFLRCQRRVSDKIPSPAHKNHRDLRKEGGEYNPEFEENGNKF